MIQIDANLTETDLLKLGAFMMGSEKAPEKAVAFFRTAREISPHCIDSYSNEGASFINMKQPEKALAPLEEGLLLAPDNAAMHLNYGVALQVCLRLDEAREHIIKSLELNAQFPFECVCALAMNSQYRGDIKAAISEYETALSASPGNPVGEQSLGMMLMLDRQWGRGLQFYEARLKTLNPWAPVPTPHYEHVAGATLGGKKVLIVGEQGAGDAFQFARYFKVLRSLHPDTTWYYRCDDTIADFARLFGVEVCHPAMGRIPVTDCQFPLMSTLRYLNDRKLPFLIPEENPLPPVSNRVKGRIGYCWKGNANHSHDRFRSMSFDVMRQLMDKSLFDDPASVCLQFGASPEEKAAFDFTPEFPNWFATIDAIQRLDLVITVDTAIAHLAGTLGVPCYLLMPLIVDWRWGMTGDTTEWYRSMRIFRQTKLGDWTPVVEAVREALRKKEYLQ